MKIPQPPRATKAPSFLMSQEKPIRGWKLFVSVPRATGTRALVKSGLLPFVSRS